MLRGELVTCSALVSPPQPAIFTERIAVAGGHALRDESEVRAAPGEPFVWEGEAVLATTVIVHAFAGDEPLRGEASFEVVPRAFPKLKLPAVSWEFGPDWLFGGWPPAIRRTFEKDPGDHILADGSLGLFRISISSPHTEYVSEGPDARWFLVAEPTPTPLVTVLVSRALRPGDPFYLAQRGSLHTDCNFHDLELLRIGVLQHEGALPGPLPSHYSESKRMLEEAGLEKALEAMVLSLDEAMAGPPLSSRVDGQIRALLDRMTAEQRISVDERAPVRLRCLLRPP